MERRFLCVGFSRRISIESAKRILSGIGIDVELIDDVVYEDCKILFVYVPEEEIEDWIQKIGGLDGVLFAEESPLRRLL